MDVTGGTNASAASSETAVHSAAPQSTSAASLPSDASADNGPTGTSDADWLTASIDGGVDSQGQQGSFDGDAEAFDDADVATTAEGTLPQQMATVDGDSVAIAEVTPTADDAATPCDATQYGDDSADAVPSSDAAAPDAVLLDGVVDASEEADDTAAAAPGVDDSEYELVEANAGLSPIAGAMNGDVTGEWSATPALTAFASDVAPTVSQGDSAIGDADDSGAAASCSESAGKARTPTLADAVAVTTSSARPTRRDVGHDGAKAGSPKYEFLNSTLTFNMSPFDRT